MHITGIILAGGKSSRMGTDKGLLDFNGKKLIEYPLDLLGQYCDELIISTNNPDYQQFGVTLAGDEILHKGPLTGIVSSMKKSSGEWNMVLGCDMPFIAGALIERLIENLGESGGAVPVHDGFPEPLAAIYHRSLTELFSLALHAGNLSLQKVLQTTHVNLVGTDDLTTQFPRLFSNFNSPEDLLH